MRDAKNELLQFLAGLAMLVAGLFLFAQKVNVSSGFFGGFFMMGEMQLTNGLVVVPLIIGVVWMFATGASFPSKIMTGAGVLIIVFAVIASTHIRLTTITLYDWILMLVLIFGGAGLLAKVLLVGDYKDEDGERGGYRARKTTRHQGRSGSASYSAASRSDNIERELESIKKGK